MKDAQDLGYFTEAGSIGSESEVEENNVVNEVGEQVVEKIPGRLHVVPLVPLTLRRPLGDGTAIWAWRQMVMNGDVSGARATITLTQLDETGAEVAQWSIQNAWPSKAGVTPAADGGEMMEEIKIVH